MSPMNYSLYQLFKQEPAAIVALLTTLNALLIAFNVYSMNDVQLSLSHAFVFSFLTLIYIRPATVSKDAMADLSVLYPPPVAPPAKQADAA